MSLEVIRSIMKHVNTDIILGFFSILKNILDIKMHNLVKWASHFRTRVREAA